MADMRNGEVRYFAHLKLGRVPPDGWKHSDQRLDSHHQRYSTLIEQESTVRQINEAGEALLKSFEQKRLVPYDDARPDYVLRPGDKVLGTLTNGWGHTGPDVVIGEKIDDAKADEWLHYDLMDAEELVEDSVSVPLSENQFAGAVLLAYNIGRGAFLASTFLRRLNAGDYAGAAAEFPKWNKTTIDGKKVTSRGLVRRRAAEAELFSRPVSQAPRSTEPYSVEPLATAVGEAATAKTPAKDATVLGTAVAIGGTMLADVAHQLEPLTGYSDTIRGVFIALSIAAVAFVIVNRILALRKENA